MNKNAAVVLNNIGGGINVWVDRLPSVGESVMGFGFDVPMDLAKGGNVAVALQRLGVPTAIRNGCSMPASTAIICCTPPRRAQARVWE